MYPSRSTRALAEGSGSSRTHRLPRCRGGVLATYSRAVILPPPSSSARDSPRWGAKYMGWSTSYRGQPSEARVEGGDNKVVGSSGAGDEGTRATPTAAGAPAPRGET